MEEPPKLIEDLYDVVMPIFVPKEALKEEVQFPSHSLAFSPWTTVVVVFLLWVVPDRMAIVRDGYIEDDGWHNDR